MSNMGSQREEFDFIIAGGGTAGCVLASRLSKALPHLSFLVVEAGPASHPSIENPVGQGEPSIHWDYKTTPHEHLGGVEVTAGVGKVLGGSSAVNYQAWTRGPRVDYDNWAALVGDQRWSWNGMLPYFKRSETFHQGELKSDPTLHGTNGPVKLTYPSDLKFNRNFPLRISLAEAYESIGLQRRADLNSGEILGYNELISSVYQGKRQWASACYPFGSNVTVLTETRIDKILLRDETAEGIEATTSDNHTKRFFARLEVLVSAGAYGSPKILMLSGIGPATELSKLHLPVNIDLPVGQNLSDHPAVIEFWKLKDRNLCIGDVDLAQKTQNLDWLAGSPCDWFVFSKANQTALDAAKHTLDADHLERYLSPGKAHTEHFVMYGHFDLCGSGIQPPKDTSTFTSLNVLVSPTARGTVTLASDDPAENPVISANLFGTELDRIAMRGGLELNHKIMNSSAALRMGVKEFGLPDKLANCDIVADDDLFKYKLSNRIQTLFHPSGTCAMGTVVDTECQVKHVKGLRVVDASVFPFPMGGHYQAVVYGVAEQMADIIAAKYS